ncbi:MAG: hypothetical protein ACJA2G_000103 [Cognaticolwellia sp.]|jgi:hypothetical protein
MLNNWHTLIKNKVIDPVSTLLADDVTLFSPLSIHLSKEKNGQHVLNGGLSYILNGTFNYDREFSGDNSAV